MDIENMANEVKSNLFPKRVTICREYQFRRLTNSESNEKFKES